jgi:hypothetical protein
MHESINTVMISAIIINGINVKNYNSSRSDRLSVTKSAVKYTKYRNMCPKRLSQNFDSL